jgi:hypothetical protein
MEPITLCGLVIVLFGLWIEFEPKLMAVVRWIQTRVPMADITTEPKSRKPVYVRRMPICVAKATH